MAAKGKRYVTPGNPEPTRRVFIGQSPSVPNKSERTRYRPTNHPHASDACSGKHRAGRKEGMEEVSQGVWL